MIGPATSFVCNDKKIKQKDSLNENVINEQESFRTAKSFHSLFLTKEKYYIALATIDGIDKNTISTSFMYSQHAIDSI